MLELDLLWVHCVCISSELRTQLCIVPTPILSMIVFFFFFFFSRELLVWGMGGKGSSGSPHPPLFRTRHRNLI